MCPIQELSFWLIGKDGLTQPNGNHVIDKVFQKGKQWDVISMQVGGFDIQQIPLAKILSWLSNQKHLKKLNLVHCSMTPAILEQILDVLALIVNSQPFMDPNDEDYVPTEFSFD